MSIVALLLGQPQKGTRIDRQVRASGPVQDGEAPSSVTASIFLDATVSEDFENPSELTQHPVENGADIGDHIILKPRRLTIEGVISDAPLGVSAQLQGLATTVASQIGQNLGGAAGGLVGAGVAAKTLAGILNPDSATGSTRVRDAVREFTNIREAKTPLTVVTGLTQYENFVLVSFKVGRDQQTGQSIRVRLELQELLVATAKLAVIPKVKQALAESDQGRKNADPLSAEQGRKSSILYGLITGS